MGLTTVTAKVGSGKRAREIDLLVDSGALFTVLPEKVWRSLRLKPISTHKFVLADGTVIRRSISEVRLEFGGQARTVQVVLGKRGDQPLLGVMTLEALGLMLDPFKRRLLPMRLMMA